MFWKRKAAVETIESPKPVGLAWESDNHGGYVAYPNMGKANWERYSVSQDEVTGFWVSRWQMHNMNAIIGWHNTSIDAKIYAGKHYTEELKRHGTYRI